jgi:hypothetical protein
MMTTAEKQANIEDKNRFYEEARRVMLEAMKRADEAETFAAVQRAHARKMADRMNQRLRELQEAMQ